MVAVTWASPVMSWFRSLLIGGHGKPGVAAGSVARPCRAVHSAALSATGSVLVEVVTHHKTTHAELFMSLPESTQHVRRYVQSHSLELDLPGMRPSRYDGITQIWFDDPEVFAAVCTSPQYLATSAPTRSRSWTCQPATCPSPPRTSSTTERPRQLAQSQSER